MNMVHGGDIYTYEGMIDFSVNINPFGPGEAVVEAAKAGAEEISAYPDSRCRKLNRALSEFLEVPGNWMIFGNGAADLIFSIVLAKKPAKAVLTAPSFAEYARALKAMDCEIQYYHLKEEENFCLTKEYLHMLTEDVDIIFLCSPDNPSGRTIETKLLKKILARCAKYKIRVVLDECFYEFLEEPEKCSMQDEIAKFPELVILRAFTKMYGMPGLRLGYALCSDQQFLEKIEAVRQPWGVSTQAQAAGVAALKGQELVNRTREYVLKERKWLECQFRRLGIQYFPSQANYILLKSDYDLFSLLKEKHILIRDCSNYEGLGKGYYRTAVKLHGQNQLLIEALEAIYLEKEEI